MLGWMIGTCVLALSAQLIGDTAEFSTFRDSFRAEAMKAGVSATTYDREMATATPIPIVIERNEHQPEFSRPIWKYLEGAVSDSRVQDGLMSMATQKTVLEQTEIKYGVDKEVIGAIWGLESHYGRILGDFDIVSALATLAHQGRRESFGKAQLIGALTIIDQGYASREMLKGSWAGAMGQTQFIPTTYLDYAIDEDEDGDRDLWSDHGDVFASTANYLAKSGYVADKPWGFEVVLPSEFDYAQANMSVQKPVAMWLAADVTAAHGSLIDQTDLNSSASIILPAGARGPAFMVFSNYRAILKYNNSTAYGLGIGLLSDQLAGRGKTLVGSWPEDDRPLSLEERKEVQQSLADLGYNPGPVDGIIGAGTQRALRAWQKDQNMPADGYASAMLLTQLRPAPVASESSSPTDPAVAQP